MPMQSILAGALGMSAEAHTPPKSLTPTAVMLHSTTKPPKDLQSKESNFSTPNKPSIFSGSSPLTDSTAAAPSSSSAGSSVLSTLCMEGNDSDPLWVIVKAAATGNMELIAQTIATNDTINVDGLYEVIFCIVDLDVLQDIQQSVFVSAGQSISAYGCSRRQSS